ncbi:hypothetical protein EA472_15645 [Natrarchaeobius oligotrophus]|uniref:Uncharacterized protein n=1 Tax=Natrarchaeobius chitinivorans TaxID=1679083 RepID=A0A3N6PK13_NATCH|nr:hypothetical protein EA472_15645 [Natrarchaeobius chitinivorans]
MTRSGTFSRRSRIPATENQCTSDRKKAVRSVCKSFQLSLKYGRAFDEIHRSQQLRRVEFYLEFE